MSGALSLPGAAPQAAKDGDAALRRRDPEADRLPLGATRNRELAGRLSLVRDRDNLPAGGHGDGHARPAARPADPLRADSTGAAHGPAPVAVSPEVEQERGRPACGDASRLCEGAEEQRHVDEVEVDTVAVRSLVELLVRRDRERVR